MRERFGTRLFKHLKEKTAVFTIRWVEYTGKKKLKPIRNILSGREDRGRNIHANNTAAGL